MKRSLALAVLALVACTGPTKAQDSYPIVLKGAGEGESTVCEDSLTTGMTTRQTDATGVVVSARRDHSVRRTVYRETILELDRATRQAKRLRRECNEATLEMNGKSDTLPYHGRTFVVERGTNGCRVRFEGTAPAADLVRELEEGFSRKKDADVLQGMLPTKAVRVGESWGFDPLPLLQAWPKPPQVHLDTAHAATSGKLTRIYRQGERQFGVLEFRVEVPVAAVQFGQRQATVEAGARLTVVVTVDGCIDGSSGTFALRMQDDLSVQMQLPAPASGQRISGTISEHHVRSETRP